MTVITAEKQHEQTRVDLVFMTLRPDITRSTVKRLFIEGIIKINSNQVMPNYRLKAGDKISFNDDQLKQFLNNASDSEVLKPQRMDLEIIFEDEHTLVVNKPSGLNVHPVVKRDNQSLLNGIVYYLQNISKFKKSVRPRLVHRLDKETSGVVLIAKDLQSHDFYSKQFERREVQKEYCAVVQGDFKEKIFRLNKGNNFIDVTTYIAKGDEVNKDHNYKSGKYINTSKEKGKIAKTRFYFEKFIEVGKYSNMKFSLVKAIPQTGRTHQIRVHLNHIDSPILGDILYSGKPYQRLMLHAYELKLIDFKTKAPKVFTARLPKVFN